MTGKSPEKTPVSLVNFFVFNSEYGPREGEEEKKILYYYPPNTELDKKIKDVGLCEAIIKFTETFSDNPCEAMHAQKTRQVFHQPEKDFWMVLTVSIPSSEKEKDGQSYMEFHEDDVQDSVFDAVLKQAYRMFKLFMGSFQHILEKGTAQNLKQRLDHFFSRYLQTLKLNQSDILDVYCGIHFLPLDKNTYLKIQCLINLLEATFLQVKYTAFLYNDQLVWSGLEQDDMRYMYKYLTTSLFPAYMEQELQGGSPYSSSTNVTGGPSTSHYGKFVTGPPSLTEPQNFGKIPRIFVNTGRPDEECHLLVYRALSATVCMLIEGSFQIPFDFFKSLDSFLGPQLSSLASDIGEQYARRPPSTAEPLFKYVYFNYMNLAQKTTIHADSNKKTAGSVSVPPDIMRLIGDINADISRSSNDDNETIARTQTGDYWVVGKKSDQREFYVVINQKNANLIEINEEVKKLCTSHFSNIFFLD
ncbi:vacuolar fusion protein CCZ1 homolog [Lingula anatina]|uniref:Vacuolar fusion protein CCZ1 homolog n=1 Tax=Lingula anatina TaxID=7574 RepID=A0A1S3IZ04_LINAN|nr:vacuolar fusion protein CCZ1 homolog [Lingula anatina]|eukprot:XP_013403432.1 vacuolar fusion protein CCZ1 homolog [Lingula anatina]